MLQQFLMYHLMSGTGAGLSPLTRDVESPLEDNCRYNDITFLLERLGSQVALGRNFWFSSEPRFWLCFDPRRTKECQGTYPPSDLKLGPD